MGLAQRSYMWLQSPQILDAVVRQPVYLLILFSPPQRSQPSDGVMSGFFARVVAHLMSHRGADLMSWLRVDSYLPTLSIVPNFEP